MAKAAMQAAAIREIFSAAPAILGFSFDSERLSVEVELERWPGYTWSEEAHAEIEAHITRLVLELVAEDPEAVEALRGRTFARTLQ